MPHSTGNREYVEATVNHCWEPPKGEPMPVQYIATVGFQRYKWDTQTVQVTDIRTVDDEKFTTDSSGFQVVKSTIKERLWDDENRYRDQMYADVRELIMKNTGATYVHPFPPHVIRRTPTQAIIDLPGPDELPDTERLNLQPPARFIHVDQSYDGAEIVLHAQPNADFLREKTKNRWGIINVWQPLKDVNREPLAMCDARSVKEEDLKPVTTRIVFGVPPNTITKNNEQWHMVAKPHHKWYYCSHMTPDEALLIKNFDTKTDGTARRVPHTAIQTPTDHGPPRESIEIRCLVFWEDQEKE